MIAKFPIRLLCTAALWLAFAAVAHAQATRTWVSGVGDDANPCSRTAPCKTFGGAISKTAAGGEISVLDPGGFGTVTITKSITIDGTGTLASILSSGTNGIVVNAGANDSVTIRGISINGAGTGVNGIRLIAGGTLKIENCVIANHTTWGIDVVSSGSVVTLINTIIDANGSNNLNGGEIEIAGSDRVSAFNCQFTNGAPNGAGVAISGGSTVAITHSIVSRNRQGVVSNGSDVSLEKVTVTNNDIDGLHALNSGVIRISETSVTYTNGSAMIMDSGGQVASFGQNRITGNSPDTLPNGSLAQH